MKKLFATLVLFMVTTAAFAQDELRYKDGTVEAVEIIEVGADVVKYKYYPATESDPIFSVEREYLKSIKLESGKVISMKKSMLNDERAYVGNKRRALKIDAYGINADYLLVGFEQAIDPSRSIEAALVFVGAGFETDASWYEPEKPMGLNVNLGYKFKRSPNFYTSRMRYGHLLRGAYVKPHIFAGTFTYNLVDYDHPPDPVTFLRPVTRETAVVGALSLDFGNQLIFSNTFLVDYAMGLGYGFSTKRSEMNFNNYGFYGGESTNTITPLTFNLSLKVGWLID